jgi:hypothetical protein
LTYGNTNRGALFRNDKREAGTDADYKGLVNIVGTEYWLNGRLKTSKADDSTFRYRCARRRPPRPVRRGPTTIAATTDGMGF